MAAKRTSHINLVQMVVIVLGIAALVHTFLFPPFFGIDDDGGLIGGPRPDNYGFITHPISPDFDGIDVATLRAWVFFDVETTLILFIVFRTGSHIAEKLCVLAGIVLSIASIWEVALGGDLWVTVTWDFIGILVLALIAFLRILLRRESAIRA